MTQKTALEILKTGQNVFLTGPAGSGKTFVLNKFIKYLKDNNITVAITASTGIAATHLNGKTVHSWSGLGINDTIDGKIFKKIIHKRGLQRRILKTSTLIIDEISMLSAKQLDAVDAICRAVRGNDLPFGGMQVIFCGDFFQLPPIQRAEREQVMYAYNSEVWKKMDIKICYLNEQHRQKDNDLVKVLNDIRRNLVSEETRDLVLSRKNKKFAGNVKPAKLFTHNIDVDRINDLELKKIQEKSYVYVMRSKGRDRMVESLKKSCLAPERLALKVGAQVMFVKNNFEQGYVNGTMGQVIGFTEDRKLPIVQTFQGDEIIASPAEWEIEEDSRMLAKIRQIPLRLAWAITVHKSQGMSLDAAEVDLTKTFEYGMGYVALSRVRSLEGLSVIGINEMAFEAHSEILEIDNEFIRYSEEFLQEFEKMAGEKIEEMKNNFLKYNGTKDEDKKEERRSKSDKIYSVDDIRKRTVFKKSFCHLDRTTEE
ncbi:MAG: PIF1 family DEAD/DEAH box helicase [bacterium]